MTLYLSGWPVAFQKKRAVLDEIQRFFQCGYVKPKYDRAGTYVYLVKNIRSLSTTIVPFFREHPLIVKRDQFEKFAQIVEMQMRKEHLTAKGRELIAALKLGSSETIRQAPAL